MATDRVFTIATGTRALFCVRVPVPILAALRNGGYKVTVGNLVGGHTVTTQHPFSRACVILVDVTVGGSEILEAVRSLRTALCFAGSASRILCFSTTRRNLRFAMELGKCGARFVRVGDFGMLIEAIELLSVEMNDLERNGPCFQVVHSFSQGICGPGEMISAVGLCHSALLFQLRLSLSQRFVFNLLAENRALAIDAFQIVAGLGSRFYRENGLNAGIRQTMKVRAATVKVLVARIRKAMAEAFKEADLVCDPYEVLRTFTAEENNRALYRLHADIRWEHRPR